MINTMKKTIVFLMTIAIFFNFSTFAMADTKSDPNSKKKAINKNYGGCVLYQAIDKLIKDLENTSISKEERKRKEKLLKYFFELKAQEIDELKMYNYRMDEKRKRIHYIIH